MPFTLTKAQQAVVENEGGALLVSAAAGSGKTRVLIDRLLRKIADGANIDDFLIITYTNAAAAELRAKIFAALSERLAVQPENRHLQRQLTRIYLTQISTVHAFCANILRRYAHTMDLPPDFRVAEEYEMQLLRDRVLDDVLDRFGTDIQIFERDEQTFTAVLTTPPRGVRFWALQYLSFVEVAEPAWLRQEIIDALKGNHYLT